MENPNMTEHSSKCKAAWRAFRSGFTWARSVRVALEGVKRGETWKFRENVKGEFRVMAVEEMVPHEEFELNGLLYVGPELKDPVMERGCFTCGQFSGWTVQKTVSFLRTYNGAGFQVGVSKHSNRFLPVERLCRGCGSNLNSSLGERPL